jgi:hypothetical protein
MTAPSVRLWEVEHPYYCAEGNYFSNECHQEYGSWQAFLRTEGDADMDYNLVYRWDWECDDDETDTVDGRKEYASRFGMRDHAWTLKLFFMGQRKALARSVHVSVCKDDEPSVRVWLSERAEYLRKIWEPLL